MCCKEKVTKSKAIGLAKRFYEAEGIHMGVYEAENNHYVFKDINYIADGINIIYRTDKDI